MARGRDASGLYSIKERTHDPLFVFFRAAALFILGSVLSFWIATEFAAARFAFQRALGAPLIPPYLYAPWDGLVWQIEFGRRTDPRVGAIFLQMWEVLGVALLVTLVLCVLFAIAQWRRSAREKSDLHGSAHWATRSEVEATGLLAGKGVYVGAWRDGGTTRYLRHDGPEHVLAFAPTRSGKGVGLVIPTLLSWPHSVVVYDIKGENFALTSGWRERDLHSRVLKFDPTAADGSSARFNPLAEVRIRTEYEVQDVQNVVQMLVDPDGRAGEGQEAHWIATASALLTGVILHVLYAEEDKSLGGVAKALSDPQFDNMNQYWEYLSNTAHDPAGELGWRDMRGAPTQTHPVVAMAAHDQLMRDEREATSVLSTANRFLTLYRDPIVARNVAVSDFAVEDLMQQDDPVSLYLVIPPAHLDRVRSLTRLILTQILRRHTAEMRFENGRNVASYKQRLLLMVDEFPSLGRIEIVQSALAYMAGYGIKAYLICQDVAQLSAAYGGASGRDETVMANCHVQVAFAPNKIESMELISKLAGTTTVRTETRSYSGRRLGLRNQVMANVQETERPLLTPDEARRLPEDDALIFVAGYPPIYGKKIRYYIDPTFSARAKVPAAVGSTVIRSDLTEVEHAAS
jgi:type IV secretion system protein VirD4